MTREIGGILVANVTPFTESLTIDEDALRKHIRYLASVDGLGGIVCNGHAGEGAVLTREERKLCMQIAKEEIKGRCLFTSCIEAATPEEAIELTRDCYEMGVDAVMVCPPIIYAWNASTSIEFALDFFKAIGKAVDVPLILFQYPAPLPQCYSTDGLVKLCREVDNIVAIKNPTGGNVKRYERDVRAIRELPRKIAMLPTSNLLTHFIVGADGALSGFGNFAAETLVEMFSAVQRGDLSTAKKAHDRTWKLHDVVYGEPPVYLHTRYKYAAYLAGRIDNPAVRRPQLPVLPNDRERITEGLREAGLLARNP